MSIKSIGVDFILTHCIRTLQHVLELNKFSGSLKRHSSPVPPYAGGPFLKTQQCLPKMIKPLIPLKYSVVFKRFGVLLLSVQITY